MKRETLPSTPEGWATSLWLQRKAFTVEGREPGWPGTNAITAILRAYGQQVLRKERRRVGRAAAKDGGA